MKLQTTAQGTPYFFGKGVCVVFCFFVFFFTSDYILCFRCGGEGDKANGHGGWGEGVGEKQ